MANEPRYDRVQLAAARMLGTRSCAVWITRLRQAVGGSRFPVRAIRSCHRTLWRWGLIHSPDRRTLEPTRLGRAVHEEIQRQLLTSAR